MRHPPSVDHHRAARVEVAAKLGIGAAVAGLGVHDQHVAVVHVARGGAARLVTPEAAALMPERQDFWDVLVRALTVQGKDEEAARAAARMR